MSASWRYIVGRGLEIFEAERRLRREAEEEKRIKTLRDCRQEEKKRKRWKRKGGGRGLKEEEENTK